MTQQLIRAAEEAVIYLKDGNRKYGRLIDTDAEENYIFLSNVNYELYKKDNNDLLIEIVPCVTIDTHLK